jgi:hypothetical protein
VVAINDGMEQRFPVCLHVLDDLNAPHRLDVSVKRATTLE